MHFLSPKLDLDRENEDGREACWLENLIWNTQSGGKTVGIVLQKRSTKSNTVRLSNCTYYTTIGKKKLYVLHKCTYMVHHLFVPSIQLNNPTTSNFFNYLHKLIWRQASIVSTLRDISQLLKTKQANDGSVLFKVPPYSESLFDHNITILL